MSSMQDLERKFYELHPGKLFLNKENATETESYLKKRGWLDPDDRLKQMEKPGEGNMNYVLRIIPEKAPSFIIKQARPWVEKYPQLGAPVSRAGVEERYYRVVNSNEKLAAYSPQLIGYDADNFILALEDLGEAADYTYVYQKGEVFPAAAVEQGIAYLNKLQEPTPGAHYPENRDMRQLNHQHIFYLPFITDNGFDLDDIQPGLQPASEHYKADEALKTRITALGEIYLAPGKTLLHGDFYPGSFLKVREALKVIDPEFSFAGPPEWDIAVFVAHLYLSRADPDTIQFAVKQFQKPMGFDDDRFAGFVGVEILRRLIGLAQLPLEMELGEKKRLMEVAAGLVKGSPGILPGV